MTLKMFTIWTRQGFFRTTNDEILFHKREKCSGGKKEKLQLTVRLCTKVLGKKEKALVIWKYKTPRCFKNMQKPVTSSLFCQQKNVDDVWFVWGLGKESAQKMIHQKWKILLFIDNATSHLNLPLKNVKLWYFPANLTSKLHPVDQGIIQISKAEYQKLQMQEMVAAMGKDKFIVSSNVLKEIDVLQAIYWIKKAWDDVKLKNVVLYCRLLKKLGSECCI